MIRPAAAADLDRVREIVEAAYTKYVPRIGRRPAPMDDDYGIRLQQGALFVLEDTGKVAGLLVIEPRADHLFVHNMAVDPARHGAGFGRRLMVFAEDQARAQGLFELRLFTNEKMTENVALYRHLGFEVTHRVEEDGFRRVYLRKTLA